MNAPQQDEYTLYLMYVSYFSGKMQAYLQYKEVPHRPVEMNWWQFANEIYPATGLMKVPVVKTPDGQWLQDSTPMIDWFEQRFPRGAVLPDDPVQAFYCRLLEDYADEWLWRPALHYRWSYSADAHGLSRRFAETFLRSAPGPRFTVAAFARWRQKHYYVDGDGVTGETRAHVEGIYLRTLDSLQAIFERQPFLLGARPSLADFGFFAGMFRHFACDPTPSLIMQARAPAVFEWVGRMWNARASRFGELAWPAPGTLPELWQPILRDIGEAYLPYLHANATAWRDGRKRFDFPVQGVTYRDLPAVQYRVWCRERLQQHRAALPPAARVGVDAILEQAGALEPLLRDGTIESTLHSGEPPVCTPRPVGLVERLWYFIFGTHWPVPGGKLARRR